MHNFNVANSIIGHVFALHLEHWPYRIGFRADVVFEKAGNLEVNELNARMIKDVIWWLKDEGYLRLERISEDGLNFDGSILTEKGLRLLNQIPKNIGKSYGEAISEFAKDAVKDSMKRQLADLVGQMIGGIFKSVSGS